jgi:hypothetical protein
VDKPQPKKVTANERELTRMKKLAFISVDSRLKVFALKAKISLLIELMLSFENSIAKRRSSHETEARFALFHSIFVLQFRIRTRAEAFH